MADPQITPDLLSQLEALMEAREKAARDARKAAWRGLLASVKKPLLITVWSVAWLGAGFATRVWMDGGIDIGPSRDVLSQAHTADRVTQIAVLRELAAQPFDGTTDDGRKQAGEWFNAQRSRNRADDFGAYTDAVSEAIAANAEAELAKKLEGIK